MGVPDRPAEREGDDRGAEGDGDRRGAQRGVAIEIGTDRDDAEHPRRDRDDELHLELLPHRRQISDAGHPHHRSGDQHCDHEHDRDLGAPVGLLADAQHQHQPTCVSGESQREPALLERERDAGDDQRREPHRRGDRGRLVATDDQPPHRTADHDNRSDPLRRNDASEHESGDTDSSGRDERDLVRDLVEEQVGRNGRERRRNSRCAQRVGSARP